METEVREEEEEEEEETVPLLQQTPTPPFLIDGTDIQPVAIPEEEPNAQYVPVCMNLYGRMGT